MASDYYSQYCQRSNKGIGRLRFNQEKQRNTSGKIAEATEIDVEKGRRLTK